MATYKTELSVITGAKDLCSYIMKVTDKSPKRFRFTITAKLQNYALNVIEHLYRANEVYTADNNRENIKIRRDFQHRAMTELRLLGYMSNLAMEQQSILPKQYEQISRKIFECQNMLGGWMNSDRRRFGYK